MVKSERIARQVAGTMAIEGLVLNQKEYALVRECASGKRSSDATIKELVQKYTVK